MDLGQARWRLGSHRDPGGMPIGDCANDAHVARDRTKRYGLECQYRGMAKQLHDGPQETPTIQGL